MTAVRKTMASGNFIKKNRKPLYLYAICIEYANSNNTKEKIRQLEKTGKYRYGFIKTIDG